MTREEIYKDAFDLMRELSAWELDERGYASAVFYNEGIMDLANALIAKLEQKEGVANDE